MKNIIKLTLALCVVFLTGSCKSNKVEEVEIPCSTSSMKQKQGIMRASQSASHSHESESREIALLNAKRRLASNLESKIKSVVDKYSQTREIAGVSEFNQKIEGLTREVVNKRLSWVEIICEKMMFDKKANQYKTYVAVEMNIENILADLDSQISNDQKLRQDYDKKKFEEIFNKEMAALSNQN